LSEVERRRLLNSPLEILWERRKKQENTSTKIAIAFKKTARKSIKRRQTYSAWCLEVEEDYLCGNGHHFNNYWLRLVPP